jgi:hypothetical protein
LKLIIAYSTITIIDILKLFIDVMLNVYMWTRYNNWFCRNPSLGLTIKIRACEGASQVWSPWVAFHALESAKECEGMNPHTPKWAPTLGIGISMDSQIFKKQLQGSKPIGLKSSLYHWKTLKT